MNRISRGDVVRLIMTHFAIRIEQHLPATESCLSLLTTWNNGDGKEKSFLSVADGLRKIGRDKLADWLSDTVFTQLSMEMNSCFLRNTTRVRNNTSAAATVPSRSQTDRSKSKYAYVYYINLR